MIELKSPVSVVWEITNNCNFKCPHCRAFKVNNNDSKKIEDKIIEQLIKNEVLSVNVSGGEPLLNPRVFKICETLNKHNIYVEISTNGYFYDIYRDKIKKSGIAKVQVSLDGDKNLYEKFRGVDGAYEHALMALSEAKQDGLRTQMNVTITSENLETLEWNYNKALELGCDRIFYRRVVPYGKAKKNRFVIPNKEKYYKQITKLAKLNSEKIKVSIDDPILGVLLKNEDSNYLACGAGINNLGISSNGDVYPCIFLREKIGNLTTDELTTIWNNSKELKKLRNKEIDTCGQCENKFSCGGCRAFSGIYKKDEFCPLKGE